MARDKRDDQQHEDPSSFTYRLNWLFKNILSGVDDEFTAKEMANFLSSQGRDREQSQLYVNRLRVGQEPKFGTALDISEFFRLPVTVFVPGSPDFELVKKIVDAFNAAGIKPRRSQVSTFFRLSRTKGVDPRHIADMMLVANEANAAADAERDAVAARLAAITEDLPDTVPIVKLARTLRRVTADVVDAAREVGAEVRDYRESLTKDIAVRVIEHLDPQIEAAGYLTLDSDDPEQDPARRRALDT